MAKEAVAVPAPAVAIPAQPKSPKEQEIDGLRVKIEEQRKKKGELISRIKHLKYKFRYKSAESEAVSKLASMEKPSTKNIGFLRKKKERLEFRIATEAFTLEAEKDLIRQKNQIEAELDGQIKDSDRAMDVLYDSLRRLTHSIRQRTPHERRERTQEPKQAEISLADIAIIKDKKNGNGNGNSNGNRENSNSK